MRPGPFGQIARVGDIAALANQWVAAQGRLNANLVASTRLQPHLDQRRVAKRLHHTIAADGFFRPWVARASVLLNQLVPIPREMIAPCAARGLRAAVDDRVVEALGLSSRELLFELLLRVGLLCEQHEAGR